MKQLLRIAVAFAATVAVLLVVRALAFAIYTVPVDVGTTLRQGDRVVVNKVGDTTFRRGDLMVFSRGGHYVGQVVAVPGDTIRVGGARYRIPRHCCRRCRCIDCKLYLVNTGAARLLVHKHEVEGRAFKAYHLPW